MKKYLQTNAIPTLVAFAIAVSLPLLALPVMALGQTYANVSSNTVLQMPVVISPSCVVLTANMYVGARDSFTGGQVSRLQAFLQTQGSYYGGVTGYFGPLTAAAVARFQQAHGISAIGSVGPLTRAAIQAATCGGNPPPVPSMPSVSYLNPTAGQVGSMVTVYGSGFAADNTVHFNGGVVPHVYSSNGTTLTFAVPSTLNLACYYTVPQCLTFAASQMVVPGVYNVSVENSNGLSNSLAFTVTGGTTTQAPYVSSVNPPSGNIGTTVTLTGSGFTQNNIVSFGSGVIPSVSSSNGGSITFTVPSYVGPYCASGMACPAYVLSITPGSYNISVRNENGVSNSVMFTVTGGSTTSAPSISSLSPASGSIGTTVTIVGSGFTNDNNVKFDTGAFTHAVPGNNGTTLSFIVPTYVGLSCPYSQPGCPVAMIAKQVVPGNYNVSVENANGLSNNLTFTVTNGSVVYPPGSAPVISGVSGPTQLFVNQTGTWSITARDASYGGQLSYNVTWGDEALHPYITSAAQFSSSQQTSTFTHTYAQAGTYTITFTVANNAGATAKSTITVNVGSGVYSY